MKAPSKRKFDLEHRFNNITSGITFENHNTPLHFTSTESTQHIYTIPKSQHKSWAWNVRDIYVYSTHRMFTSQRVLKVTKRKQRHRNGGQMAVRKSWAVPIFPSICVSFFFASLKIDGTSNRADNVSYHVLLYCPNTIWYVLSGV